MKKIIKSTVTSFLVFWLAACSNTDKPEIIPDRFKNFMNTYFHVIFMNIRILMLVVIIIMVSNMHCLKLKKLT